MNTLKKLALVVAVFSALPTYSQASLQPGAAPAAPAPAPGLAPAPAPAPAKAEAHLDSVLISAPQGCCCTYNPCISYHHAGRCCCDCCQTYQTVLQVKDCCTCCVVAVPVCLPTCCTGTPECCSRCGLFGRTITRFDYCCGVSVVVVINHCGDIAVAYRGF